MPNKRNKGNRLTQVNHKKKKHKTHNIPTRNPQVIHKKTRLIIFFRADREQCSLAHKNTRKTTRKHKEKMETTSIQNNWEIPKQFKKGFPQQQQLIRF